MFISYLQAALRGFRKNALTSWLNVLGLALSLSACLVIALYLKQELSFDRSHPDSDRLFRLVQVINSGGHVENSSSCPYPALPALLSDYEHFIESGARVFDFQIPIKSLKMEDGRLFNERGIYYVDSNILSLWDIPMVQGNADLALSRPFTMVVSEKFAAKHFGDEDPVGQVLFLAGKDQLRCEITGVMGEGGPSHFQPEALISISTCRTMAPYMSRNWVWNPCWTYLKLRPGAEVANMEAQFPEFIQKYYPEFTRDMNTHYLQPVSDIHLHSELEFEMSQNSNMRYIYISASCGLLLLIIASINFINLTMVSLSSRNKEVGVRKVLGANRSQLLSQVLIESVANSLFAALLAVAIIIVAQPLMDRYLALDLDLRFWLDLPTLGVTLLTVILVGLLSGLYPAYAFSKSSVMGILRAKAAPRSSGNVFRKALVVTQFAIASVLIVFTLISKKQLDYMQGMDKGFDTHNVMVLDIVTTQVPGRLPAFKSAMKAHAGVKHITIMNDLLGVGNNNHEFNHEGMQQGEWKYFPALAVDEEFVSTFDIEMLAGRDYDTLRPHEDSTSIVINKAMAGVLGYTPEEAIGKRLHSMSGKEYIVGVTEDFHYKSLHHPVGPFILDVEQKGGRAYFFAQHLAVEVDELSPEVLEHMQDVWESFVDNKPFDYVMLSDEIDRLYGGEGRLNRLLGVFAILSVVVACMGLFALTWFLAKIKTREIAIRKTLGASMVHLVSVATREQMLTVTISLFLGFPLAYMVVNRWLESFAFRTSQGVLPYALAAVFAVCIAFGTMVFIALRTAQRNPTLELKAE